MSLHLYHEYFHQLLVTIIKTITLEWFKPFAEDLQYLSLSLFEVA